MAGTVFHGALVDGQKGRDDHGNRARTIQVAPPNRWGGVANFKFLAILGGFIAPLLAIGAIAAWPSDASASTVGCGRHNFAGTLGPYSVDSYIDAYGDPACSGNRFRAFDHYGTSTGGIDLIAFAATVGYRGWDCGTNYYWLTASVSPGPVTVLNRWPGWMPNTTCGWQADQNAQFKLSGYADTWRYTSW